MVFMKQAIFKNLPSLILENDFIKTEFIPSYGCKMVSLLDKKTGREFLYQTLDKTLKIPPYAAAFDGYDSSGYDEVFPSIDRCPYPGKENIIIPDHGEIWALPWTITETEENGFTAEVKSPKLPYTFTREVTIKNNKVEFRYTVKNTSETENFKFMWALHALLQCTPKTKILTPPQLNKIMTVEHSTQTLGPWGTIHSYPKTKSVHGKRIDMSATQPPSARNCEKFYFIQKNTEGWCGIKHEDTGDTLIYRYDALQVPYLGVWKTQGGYRGDYNIALEPCTGVYDDLYVGNKIRKISEIRPLQSYSWNLSFVVNEQIPL